jgi:hypothetical protein
MFIHNFKNKNILRLIIIKILIETFQHLYKYYIVITFIKKLYEKSIIVLNLLYYTINILY